MYGIVGHESEGDGDDMEANRPIDGFEYLRYEKIFVYDEDAYVRPY